MTTDQLTPAQKAHGGLLPGFFDGRSWGFCQAVYDSGAFGWDGGLGTSWLVDPTRDLTVIVLTQRMFESPDPPQVLDRAMWMYESLRRLPPGAGSQPRSLPARACSAMPRRHGSGVLAGQPLPDRCSRGPRRSRVSRVPPGRSNC